MIITHICPPRRSALIAVAIAALVVALPALATAAPSPQVQGFDTGFWSIITDNDLTPNQAVTDFGNVDVGSTKDRRFRLRNVGDGIMNWEGASSSSGQFVILNSSGGAQGFPIPITNSGPREFIIRFTPTVPGTATPTITLQTNLSSLNAEYTFAIEGVGQAPDARIAGRQGSSGSYTTVPSGDTSPRLVDGTDFNFIPVGVSVVRQFELSNTGNKTLDPGSAFFVGGNSTDFSVNGLTFGNLAAGGSRTFTITFAPNTPGIKNTTFHFVSDDPDENPYTFVVTGEGVTNPNIRVSGLQGIVATEITDGDDNPDQQVTRYGDVLVGKTGTRGFRIHNDGNDNLHVSSITSSSTRFTIPAPPTTVLDGESTDFVINFNPTSSGVVTSTITINSDSPGSEGEYTFAITGTGIAPDARISGRQGASGGYDNITDGETVPSLAEGTDFSFIPVGASVVRYFKITNDGSAPLDINGFELIGAGKEHFSVSGLSKGKIDPTKSTEFTIAFEPSSAGVKNTIFQLVSDDPDENPYDFVLTGEGLVFAEIELTGRRLGGVGQTLSSIDDGSVAVAGGNGTLLPTTNWGDSGSSLFRIKNTGLAALTLGTPQITGADAALFTVQGFSTADVAPDGTREFVIGFTPTSLGLKTAMVSIANNDPTEDPFNFNIAAEATGGPDIEIAKQNALNIAVGIVDGDLDPGPDANFGNVDIGDTRVFRFDINNRGTADLVVTSMTSSNPAFEIINFDAPLTVPHGFDPVSDQTDYVRFTSASIGEQTTIITILSNDPDTESVYTFALEATGHGADLRVGKGGNSLFQQIANGDDSPEAADGTYQGLVAVDGQTQSRVFRVRNDGTRRLHLSSVGISGPQAADFSLRTFSGPPPPAGLDTSIAADDFMEFAVEFDPSATGSHRATVTLTSDDPFEPTYSYSISGTGVTDATGPSISVAGDLPISNGETGTSVAAGTDFGSLAVGAAPITRTFHISNTTQHQLNIYGIYANLPSYTITGPAVEALAGFGTTTFDVTFDPIAAGSAAATISILNGDPLNSSFNFAVTAEVEGEPNPPQVTSLDLDANDGDGGIRIVAAPGQSVRLMMSRDLQPGSWVLVPGYGNVIATGSAQVLSLSGAYDLSAETRLFFRIEIN